MAIRLCKQFGIIRAATPQKKYIYFSYLAPLSFFSGSTIVFASNSFLIDFSFIMSYPNICAYFLDPF